MLLGVDVGHGATARARPGPSWSTASVWPTRMPGVPGPPMNLWGADEERVLEVEMGVGRVAVLGRASGGHPERHVRRRGAVVPEGQRSVLVQQPSRCHARIRLDAGDVAGCGERADLRSGRPAYAVQLLRARCSRSMRPSASSWMVTRSAIDLAPGQLVAVVLIGSDEDHRALVGRDAGWLRS